MILRLSVFTVGLIAGSYVPKTADEESKLPRSGPLAEARSCPVVTDTRGPAAEGPVPRVNSSGDVDLSKISLTLLNAVVNERENRVHERVDHRYPSFEVDPYGTSPANPNEEGWRKYVLRESTLLANQNKYWIGHGEYRLNDSTVRVTARLAFTEANLRTMPEPGQVDPSQPTMVYRPANLNVEFEIDGDQKFNGYGWAGKIYHVMSGLAMDVSLAGTHQSEAGAMALIGLPLGGLSTAITVLDEDAEEVAYGSLSWDVEPLWSSKELVDEPPEDTTASKSTDAAE